MALSISGNLIIDEEFRTPATGTNTENEVATLSADATLIAHLNGLNSSPDAGFPQYAERVPGMPVESFIQTGERTVISYLVKPIRDQVMRAFRER